MAKNETSPPRAPRGSRVVSQAFFAALDGVPEAKQEVVARAAQVMIRDELKDRRETAGRTPFKGSRAASTQPAKSTAPAKRKAKAAPPKPAGRPRRVANAEPAA